MGFDVSYCSNATTTYLFLRFIGAFLSGRRGRGWGCGVEVGVCWVGV